MFALMCKIKSVGALNTMEMRSTFLHRIFSTSDKVQLEHLAQRERNLSTINTTMSVQERKDEIRGYLAAFPDVQMELTEYINRYNNYDTAQWYEKAWKYNITQKREYVGIWTLITYKELSDKSHQTPENINGVKFLGWCMDLIIDVFLIMDDIVDRSDIRYDQPCWHTLNDVGMRALNVALATENGVYYILKKHFGQKDYYVKLIELFHKCIFIALSGQSLDVQVSKNNVSTFTMDLYNNIVKNKTGYSTFHLPIKAAMHLAGIKNSYTLRKTKRIIFEMAHLCQVENDFLDCYNNAEITEDTGTDIQNNKCSWLAVVCMQHASGAQRKIMQECYGKNDPEKIAQVKNLYNELELPNLFVTYKKETGNMIRALIEQSPENVPKNTFSMAMEELFKI